VHFPGGGQPLDGQFQGARLFGERQPDEVPVPAVVRLKAPPTTPETFNKLAEALVQVWSAPRSTLLEMLTAPVPDAMVMPFGAVFEPNVPASIVSLLPLMLIAFVAGVPAPVKFRLLIVKSWPSVVDKLPAVAPVLAKKTFVVAPGVCSVLVEPPAVVTQLVLFVFSW